MFFSLQGFSQPQSRDHYRDHTSHYHHNNMPSATSTSSNSSSQSVSITWASFETNLHNPCAGRLTSAASWGDVFWVKYCVVNYWWKNFKWNACGSALSKLLLSKRDFGLSTTPVRWTALWWLEMFVHRHSVSRMMQLARSALTYLSSPCQEVIFSSTLQYFTNIVKCGTGSLSGSA